MKFSLLVLAGALTATNASSNKLSTTPRRLEDNGNGDDQYGEYWVDSEVITSSNIMVFEACYTVSSRLAEDIENYDNIYALVKAGNALPEQGYVTFFTNTDMSSSERMAVTAGDYIAAKVMANANADEYQRKICKQYQEYCEQEQNKNYYYNAQNGDANGNGRNLFYAPDCSECSIYYSNYYQQDTLKKAVSNMAHNLAQCMQTGYKDQNGYEYYAGFACGSQGDAVEIATFLDEDCTIQGSVSASKALANLGNVNNYPTSTIVEALGGYMQTAMTETTTPCYAPLYDDPDEYNQEDEDGYNEKQNYENYVTSQVSQECHMMSGHAVYVSDCNPNYQNEQDAQEYAYAWYEVDVEDPEDIDEVCAVMNAKISGNKAANWNYFYNEDQLGTAYDRDRHGRLKGSANSSNKMHGGLIFLIVVLVIGAVVAPVAWRIKKKRASATNGDTAFQGGTMA